MTTVVQLRRFDTSQPWGFKMQGGTDVGIPLFVAHVSLNSVSGQAGLKPGDGILKIGGTDVTGFTHEEARGEMIRCGNDVDLTVQRDAVNAPQPEVVQEERPRMSVSDAEGPYQDVTPKTYQILEKELDGKAGATGAGGAARPASIFDKKRQNRSAYTKTDHSGYQKCIGQTK